MSSHQSAKSPIHTLNPNSTMARASLLMNAHGYDALPVVDGEEIVGVVSTSDIEKLIEDYSRQRSTDRASLLVGNFMSSAILKVDPSADLAGTLEKMISSKNRALILAEGSEIVGVLSEKALLRLLIDLCKEQKLSVDDVLGRITRKPSKG